MLVEAGRRAAHRSSPAFGAHTRHLLRSGWRDRVTRLIRPFSPYARRDAVVVEDAGATRRSGLLRGSHHGGIGACDPALGVLGLGVLLLFHPTFGTLPLPYFFDAAPIRVSPLSSPWDWFRSLLVPWLVAAAPLAAMCLRLVVVLLREQQGNDHVRTATAKGVPRKRVIRRHAGPFARSATASLVGVSAPIVVINLILVERVFAVQGFFVHTWKATGRATDGYQDGLPRGTPPSIDLEMLAGIAIWASVFVVVLRFAMEFALLRLDPRVRTPQQL